MKFLTNLDTETRMDQQHQANLTNDSYEKRINNLQNELYSYKALFQESFMKVQDSNNAKLVQALEREIENLNRKLEKVEQEKVKQSEEIERLKQQLNSTQRQDASSSLTSEQVKRVASTQISCQHHKQQKVTHLILHSFTFS